MKLKISLFLAGLFLMTSCAFEDMDISSETGTGGSMARFTIKGNHLYTVDHTSLNTFDISDPADIKHNQRQNVGFGIETIFPRGDKLFLGARNGMYIYSIEEPEKPVQMSYTDHFWSYDPVVVQGNYAYVTLRNDENSWRNLNQLQIYEISNSYNPEIVAEYDLEGPRGLAIDGETLFICDKNALKVYTVSNHTQINPNNPLFEFPIKGIDIIPKGSLVHVIAEDGFYNYSFENNEMELLGKISIPLN
ncbi:MAG: LVIVD repeat-containing protein [Marinilabiliaceae bacterium]